MNYNLDGKDCQPCSSGTVPTPSKLSCQCPPGSIMTEITPLGIQCQTCPAGLYPSASSLECVSCQTPPCCPAGSVYRTRNVDGSIFIDASNSSDAQSDQCLACVK
ncbi:hypothetical protein OSTOST_18249, partial [Ostertagia ostertagi]